MTTAARVVFAALVVATFAAFFVAQRLKHTPTALQQVRGAQVFSPNGDGRLDKLAVSWELKKADTISVDVIDKGDNEVASLLTDRRLKAHRRLTVTWDGRNEGGHRAPDGIYRLRVTLSDEGRTVIVRHRYRLDTTPPDPVVASVGPLDAPGPELLPNAAGEVVVHTKPTGREPAVVVYRTSGAKPQFVTRLPVERATAVWDGKLAGSMVSHGTYVAVAEWRDEAGNLGTSVPIDPKTNVPALRYGERYPGNGGITVRYLELQPPAEPVKGGAVVTFGVDARGARYEWDLRRLGATKPVRSGTATHSPFHIHAPRGTSGLYLFEVRSGPRTATAPIAVNAVPKRPVLVVLPFMTWQGRNPVDDDGDGAPNVLDRGLQSRVGRVFAGGLLPQGFREAEGPLLAFLARHGRAFDITTDVALAAGRGPKLAGHHGVLLPGDVRWLPRDLQLALRGFVRSGGTLVSTGTDSLRREVAMTPEGVLSNPTSASPTNLFGSKLKPVVVEPTTITNLEDKIALFSGDVFGGTGVLAGFRGYEPTAALGSDEQLAASAVTSDSQTVLVAARFGKGLEIRTGLLDFATRLKADGNTGQLMLRTWTLLANQ